MSELAPLPASTRKKRRDKDHEVERLDLPATRGYQQEMLDESLQRNIIIALDTGSGKTLIAVLRIKHELEREPSKVVWFFAPTVALCEQQRDVLQTYLPVSVGLISGSNEPIEWRKRDLWKVVLAKHRVIVSTPQVILDALRHGYIKMGEEIALIIFDEAHHAVGDHPYNCIMREFYMMLPPRRSDIIGGVRPMILGLTASPIYGGDVAKAFQTIEANLDCTIRAPRRNRLELAQYVHRPVFRHAMYRGVDPLDRPFSTNLAALQFVSSNLNIEEDPFIIGLRRDLARMSPGAPEYFRRDQSLSKAIATQGTFTHRGIRDLVRSATEILESVGAWAADWYIDKVIERTKDASNPYKNIMRSWRMSEKVYLLSILDKVTVSGVSYHEDDLECSDKVRALVDVLLVEKAEVEERNERWSCIIFVQRRDVVLALAEILRHHPRTKELLKIGTLLGTSDSSYRHSVMDITKTLGTETQGDTLAQFKIGEKNLLISTAVAEEGIDIQGCGSVIRWDLPQNMASWAQSRGRARKERSTFTLLFQDGNVAEREAVQEWMAREQQMIDMYNDPSRDSAPGADELGLDWDDEMDTEDEDLAFRVLSTGAVVTLASAISHLSHFCAVIPNSDHVDNRPVYDIDPPDFPMHWHTFDGSRGPPTAYQGPFGSTVTLPRTLPLPQRSFTVPMTFASKLSAHRHAAFTAYVQLYEQGLLDDNLLPISSVLQPELEDEVKEMLADVEKRAGMAKVSMSVDPWARLEEDGGSDFYLSVLEWEGSPPLLMFTHRELIRLGDGTGGPVLHRKGKPPLKVTVSPAGRISANDPVIDKAKRFTRLVFWSLNHARMSWENLDFSYLFFPKNLVVDEVWEERRSWSEEHLADLLRQELTKTVFPLMVNAEAFVKQFGCPNDLEIVQRHLGSGRPLKFIGWRDDALSDEEIEGIADSYRKTVDEIKELVRYPLIVAEALPPRMNFLIPILRPKGDVPSTPVEPPMRTLLIPSLTGVLLLSRQEMEYAFLLPSILRSIYMSLTAHSLRTTLFPPITSSDECKLLQTIPISLLTVAVTAPSSGERLNYQRMETLGDTVLKLMAGLQIMAEYPLWHEGYLTKKKDHAVSNVRLAKENLKRGLYRWIIRDTMLGKKWKPKYATPEIEAIAPVPAEEDTVVLDEKAKKKKANRQLSTKVLADVVESVIGSAYLHGSFDLSYLCVKFFSLGLRWAPLQDRVAELNARVRLPVSDIPPALADVEEMLGYTFVRKLLLIEALTHASYQQDDQTTSYERMEFLGDSVLDMVVTDMLYRAEGKNYSPGHMHLRKSAVVNGHFLAFVCLRTCLVRMVGMPRPRVDPESASTGGSGRGRRAVEIEVPEEESIVYFWRCLLHSSPQVLTDQHNTFTRFKARRGEIEEALSTSKIFPWAALTRLQASKMFSDMVESVLGAIFLDSGGDFDVVRGVLYKLGILQVLERIIRDDVDVLHPVSRLSLWAQKHGKEVSYDYGREKGEISCIISVDGEEAVIVRDVWRGHVSREEVKYAAAEEAIAKFGLWTTTTAEGRPKARSGKNKKKKRSKSGVRLPVPDAAAMVVLETPAGKE